MKRSGLWHDKTNFYFSDYLRFNWCQNWAIADRACDVRKWWLFSHISPLCVPYDGSEDWPSVHWPHGFPHSLSTCQTGRPLVPLPLLRFLALSHATYYALIYVCSSIIASLQDPCFATMCWERPPKIDLLGAYPHIHYNPFTLESVPVVGNKRRYLSIKVKFELYLSIQNACDIIWKIFPNISDSKYF